MIHHQDPWLTIHAGDCRDVLRELPSDSVHCVVTSPPYWNLRDYGTARWDGGDPACDHVQHAANPQRGLPHAGANSPAAMERTMATRAVAEGTLYRGTCGRCGAVRVDHQLGLEATPELYVDAMVEVFREVRRVLRKDGTLWLNLGDTYADRANMGRGQTSRRDRGDLLPSKPNSIGGGFRLKAKDLIGIPWRVAFALQADGWYLRRDVIWNKPNPMPESVDDRPTNAHEYLFLLSKSERYHYDAEAVREPHARDWSGGRSGGTLAGRGKRGAAPPQPGDPNYRSGASQWERTEAPEPNPSGRNLRDVWTVPTQQYPEAHFATFPEDLVTRPILAGTSERGACGECGTPWTRRVVKPKRKSWHSHGDDARHGAGGAPGEGSARKRAYLELKDQPRVEVWTIACKHDAAPVPCVVLDPFGGSGTVAQVANRLSRRAILVDLNPDYLDQQLRRAVDRPLGL